MFDIIDNVVKKSTESIPPLYMFNHPIEHGTNQLAKMRTNLTEGNSPSIASLLFLMSRTRIRSVRETKTPIIMKKLFLFYWQQGIAEGLANQNVNITGSGSPGFAHRQRD